MENDPDNNDIEEEEKEEEEEEDLEEEDPTPSFLTLQEGLSQSTLDALLKFLPNRRFDDEENEDKDSEYEAEELAASNTKKISDSTVCVAYTQRDVDVIAETFKRLAERHSDTEREREELKAKALSAQRARLLPLQATEDRKEAADLMRKDGVVRLNGLLSEEICDRLLASINESLTREIENGNIQVQETGFGNVLCREHRWDLYLRNEGVYNDALIALLGRPECKSHHSNLSKIDDCEKTIATSTTLSSSSDRKITALGSLFLDLFEGKTETTFHELSALVSDPGANSQPIHPDSTFTEEAPLYTVFIALQDVTREMGPTIFLPGTNTETSHREHKDASTKDLFLAGCQYREGLLGKGDVAVMDSRTLHCGSANTGSRRILMYFTVRNPSVFFSCNPPIPTGSKWTDIEVKLSDFLEV